MPLGVLCRAGQELCRCLTFLVEQGVLLDLKMMDMARKDPMAPPVPTEGASSSKPRVEEPISLPASDKLPPLEPKEGAHSDKLALVQRRRPPAPHGFTLSWVDESNPSPEEPYWSVYPRVPDWT